MDTNHQKTDVLLDLCIEDQEVDDYFNLKGIINTDERIQFLHNYMNVISTSNFGELSDADQYKLAKEVFVAGRWRSLSINSRGMSL
jgi:hypothetical protein